MRWALLSQYSIYIPFSYRKMSNVIVFSSPVTPLQWHYRHCGILNPCGELASSMDFDIASLKGLTITVMICEADLDIVRYSIL